MKRKIEMNFGYLRWTSAKKVEGMVASFRGTDLANTRFFKQVSTNFSPRYPSFVIEFDLNKFPKTTALI